MVDLLTPETQGQALFSGKTNFFALLLHPSLHMHASTLHKQADTLPPNRPKIGVRLLF